VLLPLSPASLMFLLIQPIGGSPTNARKLRGGDREGISLVETDV